MVGDTLSEAISKLEGYLADTFYDEHIRQQLEALVELMDMLRAALDSPPGNDDWTDACTAAFDAAVDLSKAEEKFKGKTVRQWLLKYRKDIRKRIEDDDIGKAKEVETAD